MTPLARAILFGGLMGGGGLDHVHGLRLKMTPQNGDASQSHIRKKNKGPSFWTKAQLATTVLGLASLRMYISDLTPTDLIQSTQNFLPSTFATDSRVIDPEHVMNNFDEESEPSCGFLRARSSGGYSVPYDKLDALLLAETHYRKEGDRNPILDWWYDLNGAHLKILDFYQRHGVHTEHFESDKTDHVGNIYSQTDYGNLYFENNKKITDFLTNERNPNKLIWITAHGTPHGHTSNGLDYLNLRNLIQTLVEHPDNARLEEQIKSISIVVDTCHSGIWMSHFMKDMENPESFIRRSKIDFHLQVATLPEKTEVSNRFASEYLANLEKKHPLQHSLDFEQTTRAYQAYHIHSREPTDSPNFSRLRSKFFAKLSTLASDEYELMEALDRSFFVGKKVKYDQRALCRHAHPGRTKRSVIVGFTKNEKPILVSPLLENGQVDTTCIRSVQLRQNYV